VVGKGKPYSLIGRVEHRVVLAHEDVSEDPERAGRGGDIQCHDSQQTQVTIRDEVVFRGQCVHLRVDGEVEVGTVVVTRHEVFTRDDFLATELSSDLGDLGGRASEDGGTTVHDRFVLGRGYVGLAYRDI
jgi:hypothetical protein